MRMRPFIIAVLILAPAFSRAHDAPIHREERTYTIHPAADPAADAPRLVLRVVDAETGEPSPARFSISIDGRPWAPPARLP